MPDLVTRGQHEQDFAYGYSLVVNRQRSRLVAYGLDRLPSRPASNWEADEEEVAAALFALLWGAYIAAHNGLTAQYGVVRPTGDVLDDYRRWALAYARETAAGIVNTTREAAMKAANQATRPGPNGEVMPTDPQAVDRLRAALTLSGVADVNRIVRTAVTEVTRAISAGETAAAQALVFGGGVGGVRVMLRPYWVTAQDDAVCPYCRPRDGRSCRSEAVGFPPAHVSCRCYVDWRV